MQYFVQYDALTGNITGVIHGSTAPNHPNQLVLDQPVDAFLKMVDLETLQIIDRPPPEYTAEETVKNSILDAISFGNSLIVDYSVKNVMRGRTAEQIATLAGDLKDVAFLLNTGALYTALQLVMAIAPTELLLQEDKDEFIAKLTTYLGIEN